MLKIALMNI